MRLYGIFSSKYGWGDDLGSTWTQDDVNAASALEMVYPSFSNETLAMLKGRSVRIKYKNYGGSSAQEAPMVETQHHADVAYYRVGLLSEAIGVHDTKLRVHRAPKIPHQPQDPWDPAHPGGITASTAEGDSSVVDEHGAVQSFLTWLRVADEYMKIVKVTPDAADPEAMTVSVGRGLWGSAVSSHPANATALAPVYHASGCYPTGDGSCLRYAFDPARNWTAEYVAAAYDEGYDGLWMDCFGAQPFRAADAFGNSMSRYIFDVSGDARLSRAGYVASQKLLVARVRALTARRGATHLYANNVDQWVDAPELLSPGELLDGGALEGFAADTSNPCGFNGSYVLVDEATWRKHVASVMNITAARLPIMPIIGSAGCQSPQLVPMGNRDDLEDFAYASFLLAAGTRDALFGIVPYYLRKDTTRSTTGASGGGGVGGGSDEGTPPPGRLYAKLHERYFYPLGQPAQPAAATVDGYRVGRCSYARRFATALVLVNPTSDCTDASVALNGTWYDPAGASNGSTPLSTAKVAPQQGRILLSAPLSRVAETATVQMVEQA